MRPEDRGMRDEELDRAEFLIEQGRLDEATRILDRRQYSLESTVVGWKLTTRLPQLRSRLMEAGNRPNQGIDTPTWVRIDNEIYRQVFNRLGRGEEVNAVKNTVTDDLGFEFNIDDDGGPDRRRLYRKVCDHIERWQRKNAESESTEGGVAA
jgi:hypothetical protein